MITVIVWNNKAYIKTIPVLRCWVISELHHRGPDNIANSTASQFWHKAALRTSALVDARAHCRGLLSNWLKYTPWKVNRETIRRLLVQHEVNFNKVWYGVDSMCLHILIIILLLFRISFNEYTHLQQSKKINNINCPRKMNLNNVYEWRWEGWFRVQPV